MKITSIISLISLSFIIAFTLKTAQARSVVKEGVFVYDAQKEHLATLKIRRDLTIDLVDENGYELYGPDGLKEWLRELGIAYRDLDLHKNKEAWSGWPSIEDTFVQLKRLEAKYPQILKLINIGKSVENRDLWFIKISDNPQLDEVEPEVKYIANMHGDEIVGRDLMVKLIEELASNYDRDPQITSLINNTEIFIMPSMNPDGCANRSRGNQHWVDLNRDFPDFTTSDNHNIPDGRAPETQAIMNFQAQHNFALSANFHGGAVVVNYLWDTTPEPPPMEQLIIDISREYASIVPGMYDSYRFPGGITNGYNWYEVDGGMQDWSFYWHGDLQFTIELSQMKWPSYSALEKYYQDNRRSLVKFLSRAHQGAGFVVNDNQHGSVTISRIDGENKEEIGTYNFQRGEFYKILEAGLYQFVVSADGKEDTFTIKVEANRFYSNGNYRIGTF